MRVPSSATFRAVVVLLAAGSGTRVGAGANKVLLPLHDRPVLDWSLRTVREIGYVDQVVVVGREEDRAAITPMLRGDELFVVGGASRDASERCAFAALQDASRVGRPLAATDVVAVHDSARPLAGVELWRTVLEQAHEHGGAVPVRPLAGLVRRHGAAVTGSVAGMQTPQAFRAGPLLASYARALDDGFRATDTGGFVAAYGDVAVRAVPGPATNIKITFAADLAVAHRLL